MLKGVESLLKKSKKPGEPSLVVGKRTVSPEVLFREVRMGTRLGRAYRKKMERRLARAAEKP